jgi:glycosyltransferase involved in cell wall biosynthesis
MLLSIVTINWNNKPGLEKTLNSIFKQSGTDYESIVVDGHSDDGSLEVIQSYAHKIAKWTSEPDNGIYNAQNKGLNAAEGEYVLFLNSGDQFHDSQILEKIHPALDGTDIVYGDLLIVEPSGSWVKKYNEKISFSYFMRDTLPHQAAFIKKSLFEKTGPYDESLKIVADWKVFMHAKYRFNASFKYLDRVITDYDYTGFSSKKENDRLLKDEKRRVLEKDYALFIEEFDELVDLRGRYYLLAHSRAVKTYFRLRKIFKKQGPSL